MKLKLIAGAACALALIGAGCSKDASVTGVVVDLATAEPVQEVEVWAMCDELGKKVVTKTGAGGTFGLGLRAGEWHIYVNPRESSTRLETYFASPHLLRVYEKEKKSLDTTWLLPYPPDSVPELAYLLVRGKGYHRMRLRVPDGEHLYYRSFPQFHETQAPDVILFFDPRRGEVEPRLFSTERPHYVEMFLTRGWQLRGCVGLSADIHRVRVGSWWLVVLPPALRPGRYRLETSPRDKASYLFQVVEKQQESLLEPPEPDDSEGYDTR